MTNRSIDHDIIVVGGGLNGALAALVMAHQGFDIALIDRETTGDMTLPAFDGRTTALAYASVRVLRHIGLWDELEAHACPIDDILVTDGQHKDRFRDGYQASGFLHFDSRELGEGDEATPLGWIIENRHLRLAFFKAIKAAENIRLIAPAGCTRMKAATGFATAYLDNGEALTASLVLAADGRGSPLREQAKIKDVKWAYPQSAIVCTVKHEKPHLNIAQEYFLPAGPFAILPLNDNQSSLVWTEKNDRVGAYLALDDDEFLEEILNRFGDYLGTLKLASPRWSHPLGFHLATKFHADRLVLIGDAAHGIHPIAGQGYNLGIKDIAALADVLSEARATGLDIGHGTPLQKYDQWRRTDSAMLGYGTDFLNRLYSNDSHPLRFIRSTGMGIVNKIGPLRNFFMRQAGADVGDLPSLMRGV